MTYNDITYCSRECANMECKRNQKHLPKSPKIISMAEFADCENWKEVDADFMFEELGYAKKEQKLYTEYFKGKESIEFWPDDQAFTKLRERELYEYITMAELKAINAKVKELGWE